jgi:hypothetical protein
MLGIAITRFPVVRDVETATARGVVCCIMLLFALAVNVIDARRSPEARTTVFSKVSFGWFEHKIPPHLERDVKRIMKAAEPGVMIAPLHYSAWIPLWGNDFPQTAVRRFQLMQASIAHGRRREAHSKMRAIKYISGRSSKGLQDLNQLLSHDSLKNVVVVRKMIDRKDLVEMLKRQGFVRRLTDAAYVLFVRP